MLPLKSEIDRLRSDDWYYSKDNPYLSASTLKKYYDSERPIEKEFKNSDPLIFGSWLHRIILESKTYSISDAPHRFRGHLELLRARLREHPEVLSIMRDKSLKTEVPYLKQINGIWCKGKIDIELPNETWDLKTTYDLDSYEYTSKMIFKYPLSAYHYWRLTGKVQHYIVIEKETGRIQIVYSNEQFYREGFRQWNWAMRNYKEYLKSDWIFRTNTDMEDQEFEMDKVPCKVINNKLYTYGYKDSWLLRPR